MRAYLERLVKNFGVKRTILRVFLPFFLFAFVFIAIPQFAFADWPGVGLVKDIILGAASAAFAAGFWTVRFAVKLSTDIFTTSAVGSTWAIVRNTALSLFGIAILIIGFMNLMRIQIQTWSVNRMIPKLALAAFLVIFSKFICISLINFATALASTFMSMGSENPLNNFKNFGLAIIRLQGSGVGIGFCFAVLIMALLAMFTFFFLAIALLFRAIFLVFLIILSPFAFAMSVLPFTEQYSKQWWKEFTKWTFFFPICLLILTVAMIIVMSTADANYNVNQIVGTAGGETAISQDQTAEGDNFWQTTATYLIGFVAIPLSVYLPLKMLGAAGSTLQGAMSGKSGTRANPAKIARDAWSQRQKNREESRKGRPPLLGNTLVGRTLSGRSKFDAAKRDADMYKGFESLSAGAKDYFDEHQTMRGCSAPDAIAAQGWERQAGRLRGAKNVHKAYTSTYGSSRTPGQREIKTASDLTTKHWQGATKGIVENMHDSSFDATNFSVAAAERLGKDKNVKGAIKEAAILKATTAGNHLAAAAIARNK